MNVSAKIEAIQNLHATHNIIGNLEQSKASIEQLVDEMPDALFIFDSHGRLYRSNLEGCRLLQVDPEDYFGLTLDKIFSRDAAQIIYNKVQLVSQNPKAFERPHEFELEAQTPDGKVYPYHWALRPLAPEKFERICLFVLFGRNLSEIRSFERELSQIYSSIPIGILAVGAEGQIEAHYSRYCEYILQHERYSGLDNGFAHLSIVELLFEPSFDSMRSTERDAAQLFVNAIGESEYWFESIRTQLPQLIKRKALTGDLWLRVDYFPVISEGKVKKVLLIIENRSDLVRERQEQSVWIKRNESAVRRILEIQNSESHILQRICTDLDSLIRSLDSAWDKSDYLVFKNGVAGIARSAEEADFSTIKDMVEIFRRKLDGDSGEELFQSRDALIKGYSELRTECLEVIRVYHSLSAQETHHQDVTPRFDPKLYQDITDNLDESIKLLQNQDVDQVLTKLLSLRKQVQQVTFIPLSRMEQVLNEASRVKALTEGKLVTMTCAFEHVLISPEQFRPLRDMLCFLLEKSITHAIETPAKRRKLGKPEVAEIHLQAVADAHGVLFRLSDDGKGISAAKLRDIARTKGTIEDRILQQMPENEVLQLVFTGNLLSASRSRSKHAIVDLADVKRFFDQVQAEEIHLSSQLHQGTSLQFRLRFPTALMS